MGTLLRRLLVASGLLLLLLLLPTPDLCAGRGAGRGLQVQN